MVTLKDVLDAQESIRGFIHRTPLVHSNSLSRITGAEVWIKAENLQKTGSFKVRGAFNRLKNLGGGSVIAASMGNHAQGVAYAAQQLGMHARIVMPVSAPIVKEEATRSYGADVVLHGEGFGDALEFALAQEGYTFIHPFDDDLVMAGQGTIGIEVLEDLDRIDSILVPVGGGGLIAGLAVAVKGRSRGTAVIGVQTVSATSARDSLAGGEIVERQPRPTLADGIAVGRVGDRAFRVMKEHADGVVVVKEDAIALAILLYLERNKLVVEGAGAVTLAALLSEPERFRGQRVVLIVSGGNIDFTLIDRIIHQGLLAGDRIAVFAVAVDDTPGSLHALTGVIAARRGNILHVVHDRFARDLPVGKTRVVFTVETRGRQHLAEILSDLAKRGFEATER